jgi:sialate O-acetylesterase
LIFFRHFLLAFALVNETAPAGSKPVVLKESHQVLQRNTADRASCVALLPAGIDSTAELLLQVKSSSETSKTKAQLISWDDKVKAVSIRDLAVGGPYSIRVIDERSPDKPLLQFDDVLVGDIWVLGGQSNMFGADVVKESLPAISGINMLDLRHFERDAHWSPAVPPIHRIPEPFAMFTLKSQHPEYSDQRIREIIDSKTPVGGIDGSYFFARKLFSESKVPIGLIPCATGGSLSIWNPLEREKNRYGFMMHHISSAGGRVKGLLFFQGEQDAIFGDEDQTLTKPSLIEPTKTYGQRFATFVSALRDDVGDPKMPVIFAQICRHHNGPAGRDQSWEWIRETQRRIPDELPFAHCVPSIDLDVMDGLHLDYESHRRMGERMAYLALAYVKAEVPPRTEIRLKSATIGSTLRPTIVVEFSGVTGKLRAGGRPTGFVLKNKTTGQPVDWIYKVDFDPARPNVVVLHSTGQPNPDHALYYGPGPAPYVNIVDENDMPLPAFGPIMVRMKDEGKG